jgi:UDP-3-O-[3-hydroxymyristoyl] glucosamine N-acyltransferase
LKLSAAKIAELVNGTVDGDSTIEVSQVAKIEDAEQHNLCFISNKKYIHYLQTTKAGIVLIDEKLNPIPEGVTVIRCGSPYVAFCQILIQFFSYKDPNQGIHPTAVIEPTASIGENCYIGPNAYIGQNVKVGNNCKIFANTAIYENTTIGNNTMIYSNVSIYYETIIGNNCIIHSGTAIGSDGFGHAPLPDGSYIKIPQIGNVIIEDDVEIGSNCGIDRANMGATRIGKGCRLDNLIQIAHGVEIGKNTVIAGQVAIAGSAKVGDNVVIAGQAGIVGHVSVANGVQIGGKAGVNSDITEPGGKYADAPHLPIADSLKSRVLYRNLPEMDKRIRQLEKLLAEKNANNG